MTGPDRNGTVHCRRCGGPHHIGLFGTCEWRGLSGGAVLSAPVVLLGDAQARAEADSARTAASAAPRPLRDAPRHGLTRGGS